MCMLAIVGNGMVGKDQAKLIDACDLVIRFNEWKNYGENCGQRVDVLCICNTGNPARDFIRRACIRKAPFYDLVSEIWFPRDSSVHKEHAKVFAPSYPARKFDDQSDLLVASNALSAKRIVRFSRETNQRVFQALRARARQPFTCPSTGMLGIDYVLTEPRFADYKKNLFGFGFQGWEGHPWEAEQEQVKHYCSVREDVLFWKSP